MKPRSIYTLSAQAMEDGEKLRAWLSEWQADRWLSAEEPGTFRESLRSRTESGSARPSCKTGHIYLLDPACERPVAPRPRYVGILSRRSDGRVLAAPFGRFSVPAVPGELSTGRKALPLRILCVWNARWISRADVPEAWEVAVLGKREQFDAILVYKHLVEGRPLEKRLAARTGPEIRHPRDPRFAYLDVEAQWARRCLPGFELAGTTRPGFRYEAGSDRELKKAAEKRAIYRVRGKSRGRDAS